MSSYMRNTNIEGIEIGDIVMWVDPDKNIIRQRKVELHKLYVVESTSDEYLSLIGANGDHYFGRVKLITKKTDDERIGRVVKVKNKLGTYRNYSKFVRENKPHLLSKFKHDTLAEEGVTYKIAFVGKHPTEENVKVAIIHNKTSAYVINVNYLKLEEGITFEDVVVESVGKNLFNGQELKTNKNNGGIVMSKLNKKTMVEKLGIKKIDVVEERGVVRVELENGNVGRAKCSDEDEFDAYVGFAIALLNAHLGSKERTKSWFKRLMERKENHFHR